MHPPGVMCAADLSLEPAAGRMGEMDDLRWGWGACSGSPEGKKVACIFQWADQMCGCNHIHRTIITESETLQMETDRLGQVARLLLLQLCPQSKFLGLVFILFIICCEKAPEQNAFWNLQSRRDQIKRNWTFTPAEEKNQGNTGKQQGQSPTRPQCP